MCIHDYIYIYTILCDVIYVYYDKNDTIHCDRMYIHIHMEILIALDSIPQDDPVFNCQPSQLGSTFVFSPKKQLIRSLQFMVNDT